MTIGPSVRKEGRSFLFNLSLTNPPLAERRYADDLCWVKFQQKNMNIGKAIKDLRMHRGLKQSELADRAGVTASKTG
jgi:hypothetical protein